MWVKAVKVSCMFCFWVCPFFLTLKSRVLIFMNMSRTVSSMAHESECCPMNPWLSPNLCGFRAVEVPCILFFLSTELSNVASVLATAGGL